jgi:multiple sugar transport system substrate-binding protein/raffinose/stachyose/melibiose transport system substrate-binding protein
MIMKKEYTMKKAVIVIAVVCGVLFLGCQKKDAADGKITLTFHHFSTEQEVRDGNAGATAFRYAIAEWEKEHPNVILEQTVLDNDSWKVKTAALASANDLPDVALVQGMWTKEWVANNLILPLDEVIKASPHGSQYKDGLFAPFRVDGKIYGIPILATGSCTVVAYDSQLWAEAGYSSFPETWEEVEKAAAYFAGKGIDTFAFGNAGQWQINSTFLSAVGDRFTGSDWFFNIIDRKNGASFEDGPFVDALRFTQKAFQSGMFNKDFNAVNNEVARDYFINGQSAAVICGNWDITYIGQHADPELKSRIKFAPIPQPAGASATSSTHAAGNGMALALNPKLQGEKLELAKDLILYITGPVFAEYLASNYAQTGACAVDNVDLSKFDSFTADFYRFNENPICQIYDSFMDGAVVSVMNIGLQEMLNGVKTPEQVAAESQAAYLK